MTARGPVEHFFRHEYGRLVAILARRAGVDNIEAIEDAVQAALVKALETWPFTGQPENPSGWLFRVAHNTLMSTLRQRRSRDRLLAQGAGDIDHPPETGPQPFLASEIRDDLLRMLFVCCDPEIPEDSQLALALKTLCGFSVEEIALRLFTSPANVYKRLGRARNRLRTGPPEPPDLAAAHYAERLPAVYRIVYVLFAEGHLATHAETAIRTELCDEAIRLTAILAEHPAGRTPETCALLALMHLHRARMSARSNASGGLLLLEEQDRTLWDGERIALGLQWLARSAQGDIYSRYHAEAGIAAEHCMAPSFARTRWDRVVQCYELLERAAPSALHRLNRAVAVAEWQGPAAGLATLDGLRPPAWLEGSYQWSAVLADLHQRCGDAELARSYRDDALASAPSQAIRTLLQRRLHERRTGNPPTPR